MEFLLLFSWRRCKKLQSTLTEIRTGNREKRNVFRFFSFDFLDLNSVNSMAERKLQRKAGVKI